MSLSKRMTENLTLLIPQISLQTAQRSSTTQYTDLGTAENWLVRDELVDFFSRTLGDGIWTQELSYQKGFCGDPGLIDSLTEFMNEYFCPSQPIQSSNLCVGPGGGSILESFLSTICDAGDGMLVMAPFWSGFHFQFMLQKVEVVPVHVPDHAQFSEELVEHLKEAHTLATVNIKGVIICNPHNPLGRSYPRGTLEAIARFCQDRDLHLLSDEIYALSTYKSPDQVDHSPFTGILDLDLQKLTVTPSRIHSLWSISKDFGCSGLRLGVFASRSKDVVMGVAMISNTQVSSLTALTTRKLLSSKGFLSNIIELNQTRLAGAYRTISAYLRCNGIQYVPASAGVFVWAKLSLSVKTWEDECQLAGELAKRNIIVSQGKSYAAPAPGWFRLTFAIPRYVLEEALPKLTAGIVQFEKEVANGSLSTCTSA